VTAAWLWETCEVEPDKTLRLVRSTDLTDNAPYAYAAITAPGVRLVFTAGACPLDAAGETVAPGDVAAQAGQVMKNLRIALRAAGADLDDVLKTTVYVATRQREDLVTAWEVVKRDFGSHDAPSTLLGVSVLGYRDQLVEVEAVAAVAPPVGE
jgi:enamine deaminase RidA (YjgF/YER057c/UK114 family)